MEWEQDPKCSGWLGALPNSTFKGHCRACNQDIISEITTIKRHARTEKHIANVSLLKKSKRIDKVFATKPDDTPFEKQIKESEILLSGFFPQNNLSFRLMDSLLPLMKRVFPGSKIAKEMKLGKTKLTNIVKNVIGKSERAEIAENFCKLMIF